MNINLVKGRDGYEEMQAGSSTDPTEIVVMARNGTASVVVSTPYVRVTPHEVCQIITIFATVQLLPNVESINMISDNGMTEIPFQIPSYTKRDVVVCTSPLFVSEQWQNFLFAVHIYRNISTNRKSTISLREYVSSRGFCLSCNFYAGAYSNR
uniref:Glycosyltransferase family 92 protein n=1 Tax=Caenorhabditis japonica TaxID=281687 RepID=A0A8R1EKS5_CAEJA